jgi:hypothetical protein
MLPWDLLMRIEEIQKVKTREVTLKGRKERNDEFYVRLEVFAHYQRRPAERLLLPRQNNG